MSAATIIETTAAQRRAADPSISAFVSANAGSGKTRVLTNRVARLLLMGTDPSTILCVTFTKAAAAEMTDRLFALLGAWALADNQKLAAALADLDGEARPRSVEDLAHARRLFARALETPGGLKIQTIHSFCESVLRRFPLEAGVAPGFSVIEEMETAALARKCVETVAANADQSTASAFSTLLARMPGDALRSILEQCVTAKRRIFAPALAAGWATVRADLAAALGIDGRDDASVDEIVRLIGALDLTRLKRLMRAGSPTTQGAAGKVDAFEAARGAQAKFDAVNQVFLRADFGPRSDVISKKIAQSEPAFAEAIRVLQGDILACLDRMRAARTLDDTRALFAVASACFDEFSRMKAAHAALDFDDLIEASKRLLTSAGGAQWVLYKLDMGLAHILLDEGQDTGPAAWDVIESPLYEFFSGEGARATARTFFTVGDQKQSIYSFQGADAALFKEKEAALNKRIGAAHPFEIVPLKASFRTTAPVLAFVDRLFARDEIIDNVGDERPLKHFCTRDGAAGLVEVWPLAPKAPAEAPVPWHAPLNATPPDSPPRKLATEVARIIADWLEKKELLESQGRPIEAGDIMILVQSRGALFAETIRALGTAGVPVAGADKIPLMKDQGVLDLVSYARTALFGGDDLSLAETLKSPFFGIGEESLFDLAAGRSEARLGATLRRRKDERDEWRRAHDEIELARDVALKEGAAGFFTHLLETGEPSGWLRLARRLGTPCREPIEEFLRLAHEFEASNPRSLRLFLDALERSGAEISRQASERGPTVRVMTVHKAKGLEAEIVFLIDCHFKAQTNKIGALLPLVGMHGGSIPVLSVDSKNECDAVAAARDHAKRLMWDEYRRLLYVAATRAKDRLYICGCQSGNGDPGKKPPTEKNWHALSVDAFDDFGDEAVDGGERFGGRIRRLACPQTAPVKRIEMQDPSIKDRSVPEYLLQPAAKEKRRRRLSPSALVEATSDAAFSPTRGAEPYLRGRALHRLLEMLPGMPPAARRAAADRLLSHHAATFSDADRTLMREEAMRVLEDPQFAEVFAPGSLAEVAVGGRPAQSEIALSGQIDRLAIFEDRILIIDYKTNRPPPTRVEDVPFAYLAQMAAYRGLLQEIYPGRKIETALLWTFDARLMALPSEALDRAHSLTLA